LWESRSLPEFFLISLEAVRCTLRGFFFSIPSAWGCGLPRTRERALGPIPCPSSSVHRRCGGAAAALRYPRRRCVGLWASATLPGGWLSLGDGGCHGGLAAFPVVIAPHAEGARRTPMPRMIRAPAPGARAAMGSSRADSRLVYRSSLCRDSRRAWAFHRFVSTR